MRLHSLEITAFGPFAETVEVDFERLSEAGLFLLAGPTGAGKTSVLDAICFALYGDVPGDRNTARRLRCDRAAPGLAPRVVLEATLSGRRFRLVRSPAWERPKKRGTGTTTQQASVTISERIADAWEPLSSRLDETGHLVTGLVGMNVTQFTQVAMLPQGRFQTFLRARSEERHQLLQQLFRTGRFEDVERWLREHRLGLRRRSDVTHQRVADLASRISEATGSALPDDWDVRDLHAPAGSGALLGWATGLRDHAVQERTAADAAVTAAADAETATRGALEGGRSLTRRRGRLDAAAAELAVLTAEQPQDAADRRALDAARRAAAVAPVDRMATASDRALAAAVAQADRAGAVAADDLGLLLVDEDTLAGAVQQAVDDEARVRALLPRERRLHELDDEVARLERRRETGHARRATLAEEHAALPARIVTLRAELDDARVASSGTAAVEARLAEATRRVDAHGRVEALAARLEVARAELAAAQTLAGSRRETWLDLREARLDGMAAEIAGALAVGACCPVCGSAEHPHKARAADGAPDAVAEKEALRLLDDAKSEEQARDGLCRDLATQLAVAREHAGDESAGALTALVRATRTELDDLRARAGREAALLQCLEAAEADRERQAAGLAALDVELASLQDALQHAGPGAVGPARRARRRAGRCPGPRLPPACAPDPGRRRPRRAARDRGGAGRHPRRRRRRVRAGAGGRGRGLPGRRRGPGRAAGPRRPARAGRAGGAPPAPPGRRPRRARRARRRGGHRGSRCPTCRRWSGRTAPPSPSWARPGPARHCGPPAPRGWPPWWPSCRSCWRSGPRCASPWSWRCASPGWPRASPPTTGCRCGSRRTCWPTGSRRSWPPPTSGWPG